MVYLAHRVPLSFYTFKIKFLLAPRFALKTSAKKENLTVLLKECCWKSLVLLKFWSLVKEHTRLKKFECVTFIFGVLYKYFWFFNFISVGLHFSGMAPLGNGITHSIIRTNQPFSIVHVSRSFCKFYQFSFLSQIKCVLPSYWSELNIFWLQFRGDFFPRLIFIPDIFFTWQII